MVFLKEEHWSILENFEGEKVSCLVVGRKMALQIYPCPDPQNLSICHVSCQRRIKVFNQLTFRQGEYPVLPRQAQYHLKGLCKWNWKAEEDSQRDRCQRSERCNFVGWEDRRREPQAKKSRLPLKAGKGRKYMYFLLSLYKEHSPVENFSLAQ